MRVWTVLAIVLPLAGSAAVSILVLRSVLLARLDEDLQVRLNLEVEEFEPLRGGVDPSTGTEFARLQARFGVYFAREVPDEGETLLAFVDGGRYESARAQGGAPAGRLEDTVDYWLALDAREGRRDTGAGEARLLAVPSSSAAPSVH